MVKFVVLAALCAFLVSAAADYDSLHYVDDILEESSYGGAVILDRIRASLNRYLDQAEALIEKREDIKVLVADKIEDLRNKIQSTVEMSGAKIGDVLSEVGRGITSLYQEISRKLKERPDSSHYDAASQLRELFRQIKKEILTPEGISAIKEYARALTPTHPVAFLAKAYLEQVSDAELKVIVEQLLLGVEYIAEIYGLEYADLGDLMKQARDIARTDEGIAAIKAFFQRNPSTNPVVVRVKAFLANSADEQIREVIDVLLGELYFYSAEQSGSSQYDAASQLRELFRQIKKEILTPEGISAIKEYARALTPTHPVAFLAKAYLEQVSDSELKVVVEQLLLGVEYIAEIYGLEYADLGDLMKQARDIARTDEGIAAIKAFFQRNPSTNPVVVRVKNFVANSPNEDIRGVIDVLLGELYFYSAEQSGSSHYDAASQLRELFRQIKKEILTPEGISAIKEYARALTPTHPVAFLAKAYLEQVSDAELKVIVEQLLLGVEYIAEIYGLEYADLGDLMKQARDIARTDEGIAAIKAFFQRNPSTNPVVLRVKAFLANSADEQIREVIDVLLGELDFYSADYATSQLGELFERIKEIIFSSNKALAVIREYAHQKLVSNEPIVLLIKRYLQYASDDDLKELFTEIFKNLGFFYGNYDESSDLRDLFLQVKEIVQTKEGLSLVKTYAENLETQHPIALRIKAFVINATEDELRTNLNALMGGLDF